MSKLRVIAIDAMGGDVGPDVTVPGAALALAEAPDLSFKFFGKAERINPLVAKHPELAGRAEVIHTDLAITMDDKPSQAMRRGKGTSMWLALEAVKTGGADVAISAGNTGALMAMAKLILRPMADIERPALAAFWPTVKGRCIVLDVGANIGAHGAAAGGLCADGRRHGARHVRIERPRVGLLNVGSEEIKGVEEVKQAHAWLKSIDLPIEYVGFIEGDQIGQAVVDVVVVEGFAGNIALKTAEGTAKQIGVYLKEAMTSSIFAKDRRGAGERRVQGLEAADGSAPRQWCDVLGPQRHRDQKPRRHGRPRIRKCHRGRLRDRGKRAAVALGGRSRGVPRQDRAGRRRAVGRRQVVATRRRLSQRHKRRGEHVAVIRSVIRGVGAHLPQAHHDQCRSGEARRHDR